MRIGDTYRNRRTGELHAVGQTADGERVWVRLVPVNIYVSAVPRPLWWFDERDMIPLVAPVSPAPPAVVQLQDHSPACLSDPRRPRAVDETRELPRGEGL